MTELIVKWLKDAETRDCMALLPAVRRAILANDLSTPHFLDNLANIIGMWPLIVSIVEESGCKDDGDSLGVSFSTFSWHHHIIVPKNILYSWCLEDGDGRLFSFRPARAPQVLFVPHAARDLCVLDEVVAVICLGYVGVSG